jgi:all-trans-retinol dehydrogenase (NAD+)
MKNLRHKTAVVTGAAMGLGRILSRLLLNEGCRVALVDVHAAALDEARRELSATGDVRSFACDIGDRDEVYNLARGVRDELGPAAILVNNAGVMRAAPIMELDDGAITRMIAVNLTAQFWTTKAFVPQMLECGEGHIVNVASAGGLLAIPSLSAYCASKFGVVGFTDALRQEAKRYKWPVSVTCVCPNTVNTGMFAGARMVTGTRPLDPERVCRRILAGIKKNRPYVAIPHIAVRFLTPLTKVLLPVAAMDQLNRLLGMWSANDTTVGRSEANT